jgi:hypothetical protein
MHLFPPAAVLESRRETVRWRSYLFTPFMATYDMLIGDPCENLSVPVFNVLCDKT